MNKPVIYIGLMMREDGGIAASWHLKDGPPPPTPTEIAEAVKGKTFTAESLKTAQTLGPFDLPFHITERLEFANQAQEIVNYRQLKQAASETS